jgi:hypothetical protein
MATGAGATAGATGMGAGATGTGATAGAGVTVTGVGYQPPWSMPLRLRRGGVAATNTFIPCTLHPAP